MAKNLEQQKKSRKVGRPKLPKGEAKGRIVPVRFTADELKSMEREARAHEQVLSAWVRIAVAMDAKERYNGYLVELASRKSSAGGFETFGWITKQEVGAKPIPVVSPGGHPTKATALEYGIAWSKEKIDLGRSESTIHANV